MMLRETIQRMGMKALSLRFTLLLGISLALVSCSATRVEVEVEAVEDVEVEVEAVEAVEVEVEAKGEKSAWPRLQQSLPDYEKRIDQLMAKMDTKVKVGQLVMAELRYVSPSDVRKYKLGGILNGGGSWPDGSRFSKADKWVASAVDFHESSIDVGEDDPVIPVLWGTDAVHGHNNVVGATLFPHNIGLGATRNPELIERMGHAVAREVAATGIFWTFAPTITVPQNDRWGRTYEGFSEDPELVSRLGEAMILGLQGKIGKKNKMLASDRVAATAKHFVGDGGTFDGVDQGDARISESGLYQIHGRPYKEAMTNNVLTVMASFNSWNGQKLHGYKYLLTDVLKDQMGFDGFVVGDWNGHGQVNRCNNGSCAQAVNAGVDMIMVPEHWRDFFKNTLEDVRTKKISMERLDDAVRRILRVKFILGLFDKQTPKTRANAGDHSLIGHADHRAIARQAVRESLVLLKNNDKVLPLKPKTKVLVVGEHANNIGYQSGGWSVTWQGTEVSPKEFPGSTTIYEGIKQVVEKAGGEVSYSRSGRYETKPDVAIYVFGELPYAEGQGDTANLELGPSSQEKRVTILQRYKHKGIKTVAIYVGGRPLWLTKEINMADSFVAAWLPGTEGNGVADVLFCNYRKDKDCDFKGKLSFSWPKHPADFYQNVNQTGYDPLFAYGYGLNYSNRGKNMAKLEVIEAPEVRSQLGQKIFQGQGIPPFTTKLQEQGQLAIDFRKPQTTTQNEIISAKIFDYRLQEDAQNIVFAGGTLGLWRTTSVKTFDWSQDLDDGAVLIDMQVIRSDKKNPLFYSLVCGNACNGSLDLNPILKDKVGEDWFTLAVPAECIQKAGANLARVIDPVMFLTQGQWEINVSTTRFAKPGDDAEVLECD